MITQDRVKYELRRLTEEQPDKVAKPFYYDPDSERGVKIPECGVGNVFAIHGILENVVNEHNNSTRLDTLLEECGDDDCCDAVHRTKEIVEETFEPAAIQFLIKFQDHQDTGVTWSEAFDSAVADLQ